MLEPAPWLEPAWALVRALVSWACCAAAPVLALVHAALHPLAYWQHRWEDQGRDEDVVEAVGEDLLWLSDEAHALPLFGSFSSFLLGGSSFQDDLGALYRRHRADGGARAGAVGLFEWRARPCVLLLDPDLVTRVLGADAASFARTASLRKGLGPGVPPALRERLSPLLRAGRVAATARLMVECAEQLVQSLRESAAAGPVDVEVFGPLDRFSTAVVGACAFGVAGNCVQDPDWELHRVAGAARHPPSLSLLALALVTALPSAAALVPARVLYPAAASFYVDMLRESAAFRVRTRTRRTDFVDLMLSAAVPSRAAGGVEGLSEQHDFLTAKDRRRHCALAYDVVAAQAFVLPAHAPRVVARCLRELAGLPDLQQRVAEEVRSARDPDQPLGLQVLRRAPLLEKVLLEALRLEPPCNALCTEVGAGGYTLPVVGPRRGLLLESGTHLYVAVDAVHRAADLYPDPLRFDPERFSAASRRARPAGAYLPFGELPGPDGAAEWAASGLPPPASTTAALFALQEMGLCLAALLADLEFGVSAVDAGGGVRAVRPKQQWLRVQRRPIDSTS